METVILGQFQSQEYYAEARQCICDYIENFPGHLNAVLQNSHDVRSGKEYILEKVRNVKE